MEKKLVYCKGIGIGVTTGVDTATGTFDVCFPNDIVKHTQDVLFLQVNWNDFFATKDIEDMFPATTFQKALEYYKNGFVLNDDYDFQTNTIHAAVSGTRDYISVLRLNSNRTLTMSCSCPVGSRCKHCAAALLRISMLYKNCGTAKGPGSEDGFELPQNIQDTISDIFRLKIRFCRSAVWLTPEMPLITLFIISGRFSAIILSRHLYFWNR